MLAQQTKTSPSRPPPPLTRPGSCLPRWITVSPIPYDEELPVGPAHRDAVNMPRVQRQNNRLVASAELQSAKQHFEDLRGTVFAMASRRGDAEVRQKDASMALCHFFLMATASLALLHPAVAGTLAAQIPDVVSRFQDLAGNVMTLAPTLPLGGFQQALHFKSEAEAAGDGKFLGVTVQEPCDPVASVRLTDSPPQ